MSRISRRRKNAKEEEKRRKEEEARRAAQTKRLKQIVGVIVALSALIGLVAWAASTAPPPDYIRCYSAADGVEQQHMHFWLYMQVGDKVGELNVAFIKIPETFGRDRYCAYPLHAHSNINGDERTTKYVRIHVEAPNTHAYTLGDFYRVWTKWAGYPREMYFAPDGVSYYRTQNFEMLVGQTPDPTQRSYAYGSYVPRDGDYIDLIVHDPFQTVPGPYPGGEMPIIADFGSTRVSGTTIAFLASASGGVAPYTFGWNFGDGTTGTGESITHAFPNSGQFQVVMRVTDSTGVLVNIVHYVTA